MVSVSVRELDDVLPNTEYVTVPLPLPLLTEVIVIQLALVVADQAQPAGAVTATLPLEATAARDWVAGESVQVQGGGAASWVTVCVWPATVTVPVRGLVAVFAATM